MESIISCKTNKLGDHNFYSKHAGKEYYLFSQEYHREENIHFLRDVSMQNALNISIAKGNHCVIKTMSKMKPYIRYIEKEYNIKILKNIIEKDLINKKRDSYNYSNEYHAY